ncbi:MAG: hypothetical protein K2N78_00290 [Oscillospiraceae bacterium]|nr:hypothetical protein [Oscillospiraceae bacterium]
MNGIEKITARIEADAKGEIEEILREGEAKAARIRGDYQAQAAAAAKAAAAAWKDAAQRQAERLEGAAQMEAKKMILAAKQACMDEAFERARKQLLSLPEGEYAELLGKIAARAAKTGKEEIILSARDRQKVGAQVAAKANALLGESKEVKAGLTLSGETREMDGGLILRDGQVEVNCAFETQLRVLREGMTAEVAAILFA